MAFDVINRLDCPWLKEWALCHINESPTLSTLRKTFTTLTRSFFLNGSFGDFEDALGCLRESKINIQAGSRLDPADTENVPGILISCGEGLQFEKPTLSAQVQGSPDFSRVDNVHQAKVTIQFTCRHYDGNIAGYMSDALVMFFCAIEPVLRDTYHWVDEYKPVQQTEPRRSRKVENPEAFEDFYESVFTLEIWYTHIAVLHLESLRLAHATQDSSISHIEDRVSL